MTRQLASTASMVDQVGTAIAKADGINFESDPARYRRLAGACAEFADPTD